ncbi:uncharacterized protein LOC103706412 [Phoenix dactylifera]|uniref:Uncharacterized protein LOC103706412 n=1 Tax=Phoenix dactylifera TaxID=42345 RepID=A0A8B7BZV2_PHODC|nr:uncharacterized protein LOC103706412 [Phoenix dactylifera]
MIRVGSGASGNYGPPAAAAAPAALSSSTLSPLAPPFTVASTINLSPAHPPPPAHQLPSSQPFLGFPGNPSEWAPAADAAAASSSSRLSSPTAVSYLSSPSTGVIKNSYYTRYPPSMPSSGFDPVEPPPEYKGYAGVGVGPWNGPFDGRDVGLGKVLDGVSSWMDPSSGYRVPSLQKARKVCFGSETSEWLPRKQSTIYDESTAYPYNFSGSSVLAPSALLQGMSYSQIPDSTSVESCNTFISSSSYDRYMAQLDSFLTTPMSYYQATTCSTSGQAYAPSSLTISSTLDCKNRYSTAHQAVPHKMIDTGNVASKQKGPNIDQFIRGKMGQNEKTRADYSANKSTVTTANYEKQLPSDNNLSTENFMDYSAEGDSGLKIKQLKISDASNSAYHSAEPEDSMQSSSETLDEVYLAVDSPCWKGTPASQQSPFRDGKSVCLQPVNKELKDHTDLDKGQKHLPDSVAYSGTAEQVGNLICGENRKKSSVSVVEVSSSVILSNMQQRSENDYKIGSDYEKDANRRDLQCADNHREQTNVVRKDQEIDSEAKDGGATQCNQKESIAVHHFTSANGNVNLDKGSSSSQLKNIHLLIRALHSSSKLLLSTDWSDDSELEEDDCRLLQLAIQNLEAFVLRNKMGSVEGSSRVSRLEAACSQNTGLKTDVICQSNMNKMGEMKANMHWVGGSMETGEFQHFISQGCDINLRKVNGMMQDLGNVLEKTFSEGDDNSQMLLYKNLWIEAEVAMCRLKYELQLARMKIEVDSRKCQAKGKPCQVTLSRSPSTLHGVDGHYTPLKAKESSFCVTSPLSGDEDKKSSRKPQKALPMLSTSEDTSEDFEASVMTQTRALKQQTDIWNSGNFEEQLKLFALLDFGVCSGTKETLRSPCSDSEDNLGLKHLSTTLADLGFTESPSYLKDGPRSSGSVVKREHSDANKNEEIGLASSISGNAAFRGFCLNSFGGKMIQPSITNKQGMWFLTGGYDSPPSEWEHVLKEEFL